MKYPIACRPGCYDMSLAETAAELKKLGVFNLEVNLPADDSYEPIVQSVKKLGVNITSFSAGLTVGDQASYEKLRKAIEAAGKYAVGVIFTAVSLPETVSFEKGIDELKTLGALAAAAGTVLSVETHVPYGHNGDAALKTMMLVASPGVGYNYDTANVYFYNDKGTDGVAELRKAAKYVTSVHLKESAKGEPESFEFPVLGTGIVKFPEVFRILEENGFRGPCTLELEGPLVDGLPVPERSKKIKACLDYLRSIGVTD
ncbi:MAG: sugar phosphate isomerase/epimerase [Planctomycetes bacterium]|nr:sugar phosphate isomerase/epimerase [Planctomycetota bacterium]